MKAIFSILMAGCLPLAAQSGTTEPASAAGSIPPVKEAVLQPGWISFANADLNMVMATYAALVDRNLLRAPAAEHLLRASVGYTNEVALTKAAASEALRALVTAKGVSLLERGEKFLLVVPTKSADQYQPVATGAWPPSVLAEEPMLGRKQLTFHGSELSFVVQRLSELLKRPVVPETNVTFALKAQVFFVNQTPLTRREAIEACEAILALNGLGVSETADKQLRVQLVREIHTPADLKSVSAASAPNSLPPAKK